MLFHCCCSPTGFSLLCVWVCLLLLAGGVLVPGVCTAQGVFPGVAAAPAAPPPAFVPVLPHGGARCSGTGGSSSGPVSPVAAAAPFAIAVRGKERAFACQQPPRNYAVDARLKYDVLANGSNKSSN